MPWHDHFPLTRWLLTSRIALRAYLSLALILITLFAGWHLRAWNDQRRTRAVLEGLEDFSVRQPSAAEVQRFLTTHSFYLAPEMLQESPSPDCAVQQCVFEWMREGNTLPEWAYSTQGNRLGSSQLDNLARKLGLRYWRFAGYVTTSKRELKGISYVLVVEDSHEFFPLMVRVALRSRFWRHPYSGGHWTVSPEFISRRHPKSPDTYFDVNFTRLADKQRIRAAYDVQLSCISRFGPDCRMSLLMPAAWGIHQESENLAQELRESSQPCPASVVRAQVRDAEAIVLAELVQRRPFPKCDQENWHCGNYRVVEVLKGELRESLDSIGHDVTVARLAAVTGVKEGSRLLRPADRVYFFTDRPSSVDRDCEAMPATPEVIAEVEEAIAEFKPKH